jgi:hypothetical protein
MPSPKTLEPGAVAGPVPANALPAQPVAGPPEWGSLDALVAPNFVSVQPLLLPTGTVLRRVFGYPDAADAYPSWETGSWWTRQPLPPTEAEWRAAFAVESGWNGGQCVVAWTTPQEIRAWAKVATAPVASATPATPTVVTLAAAVAKLAGVLAVMANEAARLKLDGGALEFQAKRLKHYGAKLRKYRAAKNAAHLRVVLRRLSGLARHVHTQYAWSAQTAAATTALREVVVQASGLLRNNTTA